MWSDRLSKWCLDSQSNNHVACLERRSRPYVEVGPEKLDADPFKINVANGTLVIERGTEGDPISLKAHDPADLITKLSPAVCDPAASCPASWGSCSRVREKVRGAACGCWG